MCLCEIHVFEGHREGFCEGLRRRWGKDTKSHLRDSSVLPGGAEETQGRLLLLEGLHEEAAGEVIYIHIYIYIERERYRYVYTCVYIYIYI